MGKKNAKAKDAANGNGQNGDDGAAERAPSKDLSSKTTTVSSRISTSSS